jgi:hypothetical protein
MPPVLESSVKEAIQRQVRAHNARVVKGVSNFPILIRKLHGTAASVAGDPDFYGSFMGCAFAIEIKRPGGEATPLQKARLAEWDAAGAITGCVDSAEKFFQLLYTGVEVPNGSR